MKSNIGQFKKTKHIYTHEIEIKNIELVIEASCRNGVEYPGMKTDIKEDRVYSWNNG